MNDIMAVRRSDLVDGITEAVIPLKDRIKQLEHDLAVQKGVVEMVYIPVRHMTERADKYEAKSKRLEEELASVTAVRDQWCKEFTEQRDDANALAVRCAALETALRYWMPSKPSADDRRDWKGDYAMAFGGALDHQQSNVDFVAAVLKSYLGNCTDSDPRLAAAWWGWRAARGEIPPQAAKACES